MSVFGDVLSEKKCQTKINNLFVEQINPTDRNS